MTTAIILAAGQGTRMKSGLPKILHLLGGKPMIHHVIDAVSQINPTQTIMVTSPALAPVFADQKGIQVAVQEAPLGTGNAVACALPFLDPQEDVIILCGDVPLIEVELLNKIKNMAQRFPASLICVGFHSDHPAYGRLVCEDIPHDLSSGTKESEGSVVRKIVEYRDALPAEKALTLCNGGLYRVPAGLLKALLGKLTTANQAGEFYLTDVVALAAQEGIDTRLVKCTEDSVMGVNTRAQLAQAEGLLQDKWRHHWMENGVTLLDPSSVFFSHDTIVGVDTVIYPHVYFGPGVRIGDNVTLYPGCFLTQTTIQSRAKIGPFAHLREGTQIGQGVEIGNFVETKAAVFEDFSKAKHLSYIGNAIIGSRANMGAGTITCNYNGFQKAQTIIGSGAFVGSNSSLIAPVSIGEGAIVAAGSTVDGTVPDHSLVLTRAQKTIKPDGAKKFRDKWIKS